MKYFILLFLLFSSCCYIPCGQPEQPVNLPKYEDDFFTVLPDIEQEICYDDLVSKITCYDYNGRFLYETYYPLFSSGIAN